MRRVFGIFLILLFLLGAAGFFGLQYAARRILPVKLKEWTALASNTLGRRITIARVSFHFWHGLMLEGISIGEDKRYGETPFLQIDQISGRILYFPLLKNRQMVVSTLRIVRPRIRLLQDGGGLWNVQSLRPMAASTPAAPQKMSLLIPRITVKEGEVDILSQNPAYPAKIELQGLDADVHLSLPAKVQCSLSTRLAADPAIPIQLEGSYDLPSRAIRLKVESDFPVASLMELLPEGKASKVLLEEGSASTQLQLSGKSHGPFSLEGRLKGQGIKWKTTLPQEQALHGQGDFLLNLQSQFSPVKTPDPWKGINGTLDLIQMTIGPLPAIGELRGLTGVVRLNPQGIQTENLTAALPSGQLLTMSGSVAYDQKMTLLAKATTTGIPLDQLPFLPLQAQGLAKEMNLSGQMLLEANAEGALRPTFSLHPTLIATLIDGSLDPLNMGPVREVQGHLRLEPDLLTVTDLQGKFRGQPFRIEGSLVNFRQPEIDARVAWGPLSTEMRLSVEPDRIEIHEFSGRYGNGSLRLFGEISAWRDREKGPIGNLYGETAFQLEEIPHLLPDPPEWIKDFPLQGQISTRWILKGKLSRLADWDLSVKATSPALTYGGISLEQVTAEIQHQNGVLSLSSAKAGFSDGTAEATGTFRYNEPEKPWEAGLQLRNVELAALAKQMKWDTQNFSGRLALKWDGGGAAADLSRIQGKGSVQVSGARILELPALGRFADLLNLPTLKAIVFQEAEGPFTVAEGALRTETFQIRSPQATLMIAGSGGFLKGAESPINWKILPTLSPELVPEETRSKLGRAIAQGTGYLMGEIRVTGTWKNPKQTFVPKPITQIINEQIFNLQDTLKDLF